RGEAIDRFADSITVEEVMTHNVFTVQPETSLLTAVELLRRHRIGSLPVVKKQKLVGIITRSDILEFVLSETGLGPRAAERKQAERVKTPRKNNQRRPRRHGAAES
ncbi:MAG: CBS domain-containing protein, partial [Alphaproteobacteria bacterium]